MSKKHPSPYSDQRRYPYIDVVLRKRTSLREDHSRIENAIEAIPGVKSAMVFYRGQHSLKFMLQWIKRIEKRINKALRKRRKK